ncbi:MAG: SCO family protein [Opitutaceae bacterium]|nr:SCO family protein [Opitutaceae bacterium]
MKTTTSSSLRVGSLLDYQRSGVRHAAWLMAALLAASRVLGADASPVPAKPCCQEKPAAKPAACCEAPQPAAAAASRGIAAGGCVQPPVGKKEACCQDKSAQKKDACCQDKPAEKKEPCCEELTAAPFTKNSLYQADVAFTDDAGKALKLGALRGRPVVLTMFFASCGYACPLLVSDMEAIRAKLPAELRDRAALVLVSFDTVRDTPAALATFRTQRGLDAQWTLLHGSSDSVRELAALLGVKYQQAADGMFSHSNLVTILNAQGEVVHQRTGLKGGLDEAAAALAAASRG